MEPNTPQDPIDEFTLVLLRTGMLLTDIAGDLADAIPEHAYPGEDPGAVVISMMQGTIRSVLETVDPELVLGAVELIEQAVDRVQEHLCLALRLSEVMHTDPSARGYG